MCPGPRDPGVAEERSSPAHSSERGFFSSLGVVPKKDGGWRSIADLRELNQYVIPEHFKMEGLHMIKELVRRNDWMCKVDLKDACLTVAVHPDHTQFLKFTWQGKAFKFTLD